MILKIYSGAPGSGKTLSVLNDVAETPGRYVIAVPRKELAEEFASYLRERLEAMTRSAIVKTIHSGQPGYREGVVRRIKDALREQGACIHCVVLITHEGFLGVDPVLFEGWHVRIDEVPDGAVVSDAVNAKTSYVTLEKHFALEPLGHGLGWSRVVPLPGIEPATRSAYSGDAAEKLAQLFKLASNPHRLVLIDLAEWRDAGLRQQVRYWSVWTPIDVTACASMTITGASFFNSLIFHACQKFHGDEIKFERIAPPANRRANPFVTIRYFTRHRGTTEWWNGDEGSLCLVRISQYLERTGFSGFWSCNASERKVFLHRFSDATACSPKQAGTNSLRHHTSCMFVYSNKAQVADSAILEVLDLSRDYIEVAREEEDVIQFVMRGAIRDPSFDGSYEVYLYSEDQAEVLASYLVREGITAEDRVEVLPVVEARILDVARPETKSRYVTMTPPEAEVSVCERKKRRQAKDRERSQRRRDAIKASRKADGSYCGRGRPKKTEIARHPTS
ncbi:DEAD/DEAH box helicase family protein [Methylorubrum extorquens]|uniref:DEAD/DEAH box helicase family protein n=2 Tax=Methylorubrum extorquens TaxID=408 RepID=A0AAX3WEZ2_METEX|nr:DEAD/DEAH box helicase family protein [Methylorubrum extorquens]WHQ70089.1 DEAD/DEAH box helicase family protein [Methylorubrum extorquens]